MSKSNSATLKRLQPISRFFVKCYNKSHKNCTKLRNMSFLTLKKHKNKHKFQMKASMDSEREGEENTPGMDCWECIEIGLMVICISSILSSPQS